MAHATAVIDVVGLTRGLLAHAPRLRALAEAGCVRELVPVLPAVTCSVQSSMLTGVTPAEHGIVGNGWYEREQAEVRFWKQSNALVRADKVWEIARRRDAGVTCANLFWWFNMHSSADYAVTPRPIYRADGRKIPDVHAEPADLRDLLQRRLGRFPLFHFWGPASSIASSEWIAAAARIVQERHQPKLLLVYLPHLDYGLQQLGPDHPDVPGHVAAIDAVAGDLVETLRERGMRVIVTSEYGIEAVDRPVAINRRLRETGLLRVREELGREQLDPGGSDAFAVADHQVAHVYVRRPEDVPRVATLCGSLDGVEHVLDRAAQAAWHVDHARAGDLVLVAASGSWFSYHYWLDDERAPDYARTVDIHRKPGYDPLELLVDPALRWPKARIAWTLLRKKLGFRALREVIPLDDALVRGQHGRVSTAPGHAPLLITETPCGDGGDDPLPCTAVRDVILEHLFGDRAAQPA